MSQVANRTSVAELILARTNLLNKNENDEVEISEDPSSIITSDRHKEMIFKEGLENQEYYLEEQRKDNFRLPWFRYVRKESQYSEFVMLNTAMADALLENIWKEVDGNRRLKVWLKDAYRRDIEGDRWIPSDESIGIDYKGNVYNGRHRMTALSESQKEWPFYITFNCLEEAKFTVDSGAKRNSSEKLSLVMNARLGNRTTGFCKALMKGLQSRTRYTETEIAEFAHKWESVINWISLNVPNTRAEVQAVIAKAYLWYGPEKIGPFCERFKEVKFHEGDPAKALYLTLQKAKVNRTNLMLAAYKKTLTAIEAVIADKSISRLNEREEDIFQWQENWELPKGSWFENH